MARRITGFSPPAFGLQWADPGTSDRERVRHFFIELEDKRVLYNPQWLEVRSQVDTSVDKIRAVCTEALKTFSERDFATVPIRNVRAACRRYLDETTLEFPHAGFNPLDERRGGMSPGAFVALGAFRASFGQEVARLAAYYDLDVQGELATVVPAADDGAP
ncbi:DUF6650 family protein [Caulobacter sp. LARHSG274]